MSSNSQPLPSAWVERIFELLGTVYGVQKVSGMWAGVSPEKVKATWGEALGRYPRDAISSAVRMVQDEYPTWPPTLGEFCKLVRDNVPAPEHRRALPVPDRTPAEIAAGREQMDRIKSLLRGAVKRVPA